MLEAIIDPRYLKLDTLFIGCSMCSYTLSGGRGLQLMDIYSVFGTLMTRPMAVLVSCLWAFGIDDSSKAMSSAKSRSFKVWLGVSLIDEAG